VRRHDLAEDVTQQVFIELFTSIKRYDDRRPFPPWLHRIAVHRSLDELRRRKVLDVPIESASELPSLSTSPEQAAEESELLAVGVQR
jgi:RNA polymerase sigma-70 factor (ECF subfamily)